MASEPVRDLRRNQPPTQEEPAAHGLLAAVPPPGPAPAPLPATPRVIPAPAPVPAPTPVNPEPAPIPAPALAPMLQAADPNQAELAQPDSALLESPNSHPVGPSGVNRAQALEKVSQMIRAAAAEAAAAEEARRARLRKTARSVQALADKIEGFLAASDAARTAAAEVARLQSMNGMADAEGLYEEELNADRLMRQEVLALLRQVFSGVIARYKMEPDAVGPLAELTRLLRI